MSIKYQIFVSSTYEDLKIHRDVVIKAILEMGHIPVGMEMFSAADDEQWAVIKRQIEQSDYYVVIVANRYGSTTKEGLSYTEKEYDYAKSLKIPVLGFIIESHAPWPANHTDTDPRDVDSLKKFKAKIQKKYVSRWNSEIDLHGKAAVALMKAFNLYPQEGWIRASDAADARSSAELARLSAENAELRVEVEMLRQSKKDAMVKERMKDIETLRSAERNVSVWKAKGAGYESVDSTTLMEIFSTIGSELIAPKTINQISVFYAIQIGTGKSNEFREHFPIPANFVTTWLTEFMALDLVEPLKASGDSNEGDQYWTLSKKGRSLLKVTHRLRLEAESASFNEPVEKDLPSNSIDIEE